MKTIRGLLAILLAVIFALCALTGCTANGDSTGTQDTAQPEPTDTTAPAGTSAPAETTAPVPETEEFVFDTAEPPARTFDPGMQDAALQTMLAYKKGTQQEEDKRGYQAITVKARLLFTGWIQDTSFSNLQGGCFDGYHFYVAFTRVVDGVETASIGVFGADGTYLRESGELPIGHANAISDMGDGTLLVTEYDASAGGRSWSRIDKETLTVVEEGETGFGMLSMDYCIETGYYVSCGTGYGKTCRILDEKKKPIMSREIDFKTGTAPQNFFCTPDAIYAPRYQDAGNHIRYNYVYEYSWALGLREIYYFETGPSVEIESVSVINHQAYVICGDHAAGTMAVYVLERKF